MIAGAASGAMNTVGAYYAASGQRSALRMQARLDEINAQIADAQARDALRKGERSEQMLRQEAAQLRSRQRVGMAAGNVDLGSETAAAVLTSTDVMSEQDAREIKLNAIRESWGYRTEAGNLRSSARMNRATARTISPFMQAAGTMLTDASRWGGQFAEARESGSLDTSRERWGNINKRVKGWMGQG